MNIEQEIKVGEIREYLLETVSNPENFRREAKRAIAFYKAIEEKTQKGDTPSDLSFMGKFEALYFSIGIEKLRIASQEG